MKRSRKFDTYERYLEETTPEERARLEKEGLGMEPPGKRLERGVKTVVDVQAQKLQKMMDNFDVPVHMPQKFEDLYEPQAKLKPMQGAQQHSDQAEYIFRLSKRKEFAFEEVKKMELQLRIEEEDHQAQLQKERQRQEEITAKKRAKRQKRKQNQRNKE